jgi:hypothetical protein
MIGNSGLRTSLLPGPVAEAPPVQGTPAPASPSAERSRTPLLVVAGAGVLVLVAVGVFVLVNNSGGDTASTGPLPTHAARTTSPSALASGSGSATAPAVASTGRNPFIPPAGAAVTFIPGSSGGTTSASASTSATTTATATATASATTVTRTVTSNPVYVGLYGFSGSKAVFWVNATKYQVSVGHTFNAFTYVSKSSAGCAKIRRTGTAHATTICPGTVKHFG